MTDDHTYNGWTNRNTWLANLHLSNDPHLHQLATEAATYSYTMAIGNPPDVLADDSDARVDLYALSMTGDQLKQQLHDLLLDELDEPGTVITQLLREVIGTWVSDVDWQEVAEAFVDEQERIG